MTKGDVHFLSSAPVSAEYAGVLSGSGYAWANEAMDYNNIISMAIGDLVVKLTENEDLAHFDKGDRIVKVTRRYESVSVVKYKKHFILIWTMGSQIFY